MKKTCFVLLVAVLAFIEGKSLKRWWPPFSGSFDSIDSAMNDDILLEKRKSMDSKEYVEKRWYDLPGSFDSIDDSLESADSIEYVEKKGLADLMESIEEEKRSAGSISASEEILDHGFDNGFNNNGFDNNNGFNNGFDNGFNNGFRAAGFNSTMRSGDGSMGGGPSFWKRGLEENIAAEVESLEDLE